MFEKIENTFLDNRTWIILVLLILLAFILRFTDLGGNPPGFFRDEADKGYTTYSLLQCGQDQSGKSWPLFVRALNVTTSAVYQYIDLPFIAAMGMTETAVRTPACLAGVLSVIAVFLLAKAWWGARIAFWAGLFVCLSPWSLLLSRWANQSILLTLWIPMGVYFFARKIEDGPPSIRDSPLSSVCFLLAIYTYAPARLFVPVFIVFLWIVSISRRDFTPDRRWAFVWPCVSFFLLFSIGSLPLLDHILFHQEESAARLARISIFDGQPLTSALLEWIRNYWTHLSPSFLFIHGDSNLRHHTSVFGQVHWYIAPLLLMGLIRSFIHRSKQDRILLAWFFLFPIAAACTRESIPHALRSVFAVPVIHLVAVNGILAFYEWAPLWNQWICGSVSRLCQPVWVVGLLFCSMYYTSDLFFGIQTRQRPLSRGNMDIAKRLNGGSIIRKVWTGLLFRELRNIPMFSSYSTEIILLSDGLRRSVLKMWIFYPLANRSIVTTNVGVNAYCT